MRFLLLYFVLIISFAETSIVSAQPFPTAEVNFAGVSEEGTILLEVVSYGKRADIAMEEAQKKAFYILLFRGVPGSQQPKPLVEDEIESYQQHRAFYDEFFQQQRYRTFLMDAWPVSKFRKKHMIAHIKINIGALRRDLQQNKVIRKFGL